MPLSPAPLNIDQFKEITQHLPIGQRIDYYPEFQEHMLMQSIVLGYEINGHHIYSQNQLKLSTTNSGTSKLSIISEDSSHDCLQINSLCIMLPSNTGEENKLDYPSKASLGRRGQFRNGNNITLMARQADHGITTLESSVRESIQPQDGYYRGHRLALLEIFSPDLLFRDQRTHHRIKTRLPILLQTSEHEIALPCLLSDYSELHAQIQFGEESKALQQLEENQTVIVTLKLEELCRTFVISARIMRKQHSSIVINMEKTLHNGIFEPFELIDALDIKASLLQHPGTE